MKLRTSSLCAFAVLAMGPMAAHAAISCTSVTSTAFSTNYTLNTSVALQQTLTVNCSRATTSDGTTVSFSIIADHGIHAPGNSGKNQARLGSARIGYEFYAGSCAGPVWSNNGSPLTGTLTWPANVAGPLSTTLTYWACISPQSPNASGFYTDTVGLRGTYTGSGSGSGSGSGTFFGTAAVSIFAPSSCAFPTGGAPGNIALTYTAFSAVPVTGSTPFMVTCSAGMSYTLDVTPPSGILSGVAYTIAPSAPGSTGTGSPQTLGITATAPAGQPGTCAGASCTASQPHTLMISY